MAINLNLKQINQWNKEGRIYHGFGGVLDTEETQPAAALVRQTPSFFIRVPANVVIIPLFSQVAFQATTAILQVLVSTCNNDIGVATSVALTPICQNTRYAAVRSKVNAYATNTGATGTAPTGVADLYREYHQADRDAITTTSPTPPISYNPLAGRGSWAIIGSENNVHGYLFYAVAGTAGASTCFHIHSWAEFTYAEFYAA